MPKLADKTHKFTTSPDDEGSRIDLFLKRRLPDFSRSQIQKWMKKGHIFCNGLPVKSALILKNDMKIDVKVPDEEVRLLAEDIPLDIIFEDPYLIAINKQAGMVTHPSAGHHQGTLANALWHYLSRTSKLDAKNKRPGIVHRLDRDTSGVLIAAKTLKIQEALAAQFRERNVKKTYRAIALGRVTYKEGEIEGAIGKDRESSRMAVISTGKYSKTNFKVLKRFAKHTYLEVYPKTGRTHQIRVHLAKIDHPVLGDNLYGGMDSTAPVCRRHMLHAYQIEFTHPVTKKRLKIQAPIPADLKSVLDQLNLQSFKK